MGRRKISDIGKKRNILKRMGFLPKTEDKDCVVFYKGCCIVTIKDDNQSLYKFKKNVEELIGVSSTEEPGEDDVQVLGESAAPEAEPQPAAEPAAEPQPEPDPSVEDEDYQAVFTHTESVDPFFELEELAQRMPTPVFRRLTLDDNRFYYRRMEDGTVKLYASATNLIKDGYAENKDSLYEWKNMIKTLGQNPEEVARYEADKGTIMHYLFGLYLIGRDIYMRHDAIRKLVDEGDLRISKENLERFKSSPDDLDDMLERIRRFAKFCADYKIRPVLIEKILSCEKYEVASPIDFVCMMTETEWEEGYFGAVYQRDTKDHKKGDPKLERRRKDTSYYAIIDFKSGYIYPHYALQLELYRRMIAEWYGDLLPIKKIFNFSPKSESSKGYTLRDQTENKELKKADVVFEQGRITHENKSKTYKFYKGKLNINEPYEESRYSVTLDIATELAKYID